MAIWQSLSARRKKTNPPTRKSRFGQRLSPRSLQLEPFEERILFAIGPQLVSILQTDGSVLTSGQAALHTAPTQLTLRFDSNIDPTTLIQNNVATVQFTRGVDRVLGNGNDVAVPLGDLEIGNNPNEIIVRFANSLPDDAYQVRIVGSGATPLKGTSGLAFNGANDYTQTFGLDLGAQVVSVVPQPVTRNVSTGQLTQNLNEVDVYFNSNDPLNATLATTKTFYELIRTNTTATTQDDQVFNPSSVTYNATTGKAVLIFNTADITPPGIYRLRIGTDEPLPLATPATINAAGLAGSSFNTANNLGTPFGATSGFQSISLSNNIGGSPVSVIYPGGNDEPGNRNIPARVQDHFGQILTLDSNGNTHYTPLPTDTSGVIPVYQYNFQSDYGTVLGSPVFNVITEAQKQRVREVFSYYSHYIGAAFVETADQGFTIATGDLRALYTIVDVNTVVGGGIGTGGPEVVVSASIDWGSSQPRGSYFRAAMYGIGQLLGLGNDFEMPPLTVLGDQIPLPGSTFDGEPVFPGDYDILHAQYLHPPVGNDINMYKFSLTSAGQVNLETYAERLKQFDANQTPSQLDSVITVFDSLGNIVARNDNYFGTDSFLRLQLGVGTYFVGVTSTGNTNYDPTIANTGFGGTTQGGYQLKMSFAPDVQTGIKDTTGTALDGDADGTPGGAYNFFFRTVAANPASGPLNTIFVDKASTSTTGTLGSITNPYTTISLALAAAAGTPGSIVRIAGNGGADGQIATLADNLSYNVGFDSLNNTLPDGRTFEIPRGVTVMVDAGAIIKLRGANIDVGSSAQGLDRSGGALQLLGTTEKSASGADIGTVYVTSYYNTAIGKDKEPGFAKGTLAKGNFGGLVFRNDSDLEQFGIFLNTVNRASISYGGGQVLVNSVLQVYDPIHIVTARPTVAFNTISNSADAAVSAEPNSFEESEVLGLNANGTGYYLDYGRSGPKIHGNTLANNSINGLFVRIRTNNGESLDPLTVSARFSTTDMPYVLQENLQIQGNPGGFFLDGNGALQARASARLAIDPGAIVKLSGARIETQVGAQFIAEGTAAQPIIFTSIFDDRYGAGGTFDTTNNGSTILAAEGNWGGLYFGPLSIGSVDYALITFAGGSTSIEGGFDKFNAIEIHQAEVRVGNSTLERNASGGGGDRNGRTSSTPSIIFVRGAQPVILNNVIQNNDTAVVDPNKTTAAISINVNSLNSRIVSDYGRSTGKANIQGPTTINMGPLVRGNRIGNTPINGMIVRGGEVTANVVFDDTDIVHVVLDEIETTLQHSLNGTVRLQSTATESLVVKLLGASAGFTAGGTPLDIVNRTGGAVQVVGTPNHPVVFTSLYDTTVGAGTDPKGASQNDTHNQGPATPTSRLPLAGDWRSIKLDTYSNDTNLDVVNEVEQKFSASGDTNSTPSTAQLIGDLAKDLKSGDDNVRLGFDIKGAISQTSANAGGGDVDVYSFHGTAGTAVWFDIDRTSSALDSIVELLDANGAVLARSDNSVLESPNPSLLVGIAKPMQVGFVSANSATGTGGPDTNGDFFSTNPLDAGMRLQLPGTVGSVNTYYVRVRASSANLNANNGGLTKGFYDLQIRLQNLDQYPGSTVRYGDIRYAANGIEVIGKPEDSPVLGDTAQISAATNDSILTAQDLGNLLNTSQNQLSVAGNLATTNSVSWYKMNVNYDLVNWVHGSIGLKSFAAMFAINYADGLNRPDTTISVFDQTGTLIYVGRDSQTPDGQPTPTLGADTSNTAHGNYGTLDPTIGSVQLPAGGPIGSTAAPAGTPMTYYVAVSSTANLPTILDATFKATATNPLVRLEPVASTARIVDDRIGFTPSPGNTTATGSQQIFPGTTPTQLNVAANPYQLSDVVLYVGTGNFNGSTGPNLYTVNPFTGAFETRVGTLLDDDRSYPDMVMRNDGRLFTMPNDLSNNPSAGGNGTYRQINPNDGSFIGQTQNALNTFSVDTENPINDNDPDPDTYNFTSTGNRGVPINAMTFSQPDWPSFRTLYVIGSTNPRNGVRETQNVLFRLDPDTGEPFANDFEAHETHTDGDFNTYFPFATSDPRGPRSATEVIPRGVLTVGHSLLTVPATDPTNAISDLKDSMRFQITLNGAVTVFEINTGPTINFQSANAGQNLRSGNTFTLGNTSTNFVTPKTFEFVSGKVLNVTGATFGAALNGQTFQVADQNNLIVTFEFGTAGTVTPGRVPVAVGADAATTAQNIVTAVNTTALAQFPAFVAKAQLPSATSTRVSFTSDRDVTVSGVNLAVSGTYLPSGTNVAVPFEETDDIPTLAGKMVTAINTAGGGFGTTISASFARNRLTISNSDPTNTNLAVIPNVTLDGDSDVTFSLNGVSIAAADSANTVANKIRLAINAVIGSAVASVAAGTNVVTLNQYTVQILETNGLPTNPLTTDLDTRNQDPSVFNRNGTIKGLAFLGNTMYAVSDSGGIYRVNNYSADDGATLSLLNLVKDPSTGRYVSFTGLTAGPPNVEGGKYANTLFAVDSRGNLWAFDSAGVPAPILVNGATHLSITNNSIAAAQHLNAGASIGLESLAFSTLDYNLWHVTNTRGDSNVQNSDHKNLGHGIEVSPDINTFRSVVNQGGGNSFYFGLDNYDPANGDPDSFLQNPKAINYRRETYPNDDPLTNGNEALYKTYNLPGGAKGSLTSNAFSLAGYTSADKPTLYFNYFLDTENSGGAKAGETSMRDSFRVFASSDGVNWLPLTTNNSKTSTTFSTDAELPSYQSVSGGTYQNDKSNQRVQETFDNTADLTGVVNWRQARVDLGDLAGKANVQLRFDFSTGGSMAVGNVSQTGAYLAAVAGSQLTNNQSFTVDGTSTFFFRSGFVLQAPAGGAPRIQNVETFTVTGPTNVIKTYQFTRTGAVNPGNVAVLINDSMTAEAVASAIEAAVNGSPVTGVTVVRVADRVQLVGAINAVAAVNIGVPAMTVQGAALPPTLANTDITYTIDMTASQVATQIATALDKRITALVGSVDQANVFTVGKVDGNIIRIYGHTVTNPGSLAYSSSLPGDNFGALVQTGGSTAARERALNNNHEGVYIDDIVVGFAARGEMVTGLSNPVESIENGTATPGVATFTPLPVNPDGGAPSRITTGNYQLSIRQGSAFAQERGGGVPFIGLTQTWDINDRLAPGFVLTSLPASQLIQGQTFSIVTENGTRVFEFQLSNGTAGSVLPSGRILVPLHTGDTAATVAISIRNAINLASTSLTNFPVKAGVYINGTKINLYNATDVNSGPLGMTLHKGFTVSPGYSFSGFIDHSTFKISTALSTLTFEYLFPGSFLTSPTNIPVPITTGFFGELAIAVRDAINRVSSDTFNVKANLNINKNNVDIYGATDVELIEFTSTVLGSFTGSNGLLGFEFDHSLGDRTPIHVQGYTVIQNNRIANTAQSGVAVTPQLVDNQGVPQVGVPGHTGSIVNLPTPSTQSLVPGISIKNNVIISAAQQGILFSGSPQTDLPHAVPFGRIVNNTIVKSPIGINVSNNASPTILNNIIAQITGTGISVDATSTTTVVGANLYQSNGLNLSGVTETNPLNLQPTDPLFVNSSKNNFYLLAGSVAIDSSLNSLQDRPAFTASASPLGIPPSPIQAPLYDQLGQLRVDDPNVSPPNQPGLGSNPYVDRGALERADNLGPSAMLVNPVDNDAFGVDKNPVLNKVQVVGTPLAKFSLQLNDGGVGVDDSTVDASRFTVQRTVGVVTTTLVSGTDYLLQYDTNTKTVNFLPATGLWTSDTFTITLNNSANPIRDLAANAIQPNDVSGVTQFVIQLSDSVLSNWQNPANRLDVNGDLVVSGLDALIVINDLLANGSHTLPASKPAGIPPYYLDVNGDLQSSPLDALNVINFLNTNPPSTTSLASSAAEPEAQSLVTTSIAVAAPSATISSDLSSVASGLAMSQTSTAPSMTAVSTFNASAAGSATVSQNPTATSSNLAASAIESDTWDFDSEEMDSILADLTDEGSDELLALTSSF